MLNTAHKLQRSHRHRKFKRKPQYWFSCLHSLKEYSNLDAMRKKNITFIIFLGHKRKPVIVSIKKIKHLRLTKHGKRVRMELEIAESNWYKIIVIYNKDNHTMVVGPVPKKLLK